MLSILGSVYFSHLSVVVWTGDLSRISLLKGQDTIIYLPCCPYDNAQALSTFITIVLFASIYIYPSFIPTIRNFVNSYIFLFILILYTIKPITTTRTTTPMTIPTITPREPPSPSYYYSSSSRRQRRHYYYY